MGWFLFWIAEFLLIGFALTLHLMGRPRKGDTKRWEEIKKEKGLK